MIDKNSALFSVPLAMLAASKGVVISPVEGTPLSELVKSTNDMMVCAGQCIPVGEANDSSLVMDYAGIVSSYSSGDTETAHDTAMDSFTSEISKSVSNHISFAKNVVKPVIVDMVNEVQKAMGEVVCPSTNFKIEINDLPKPMQNAGFETSINKFSEKPFLAPEGELRLGEISPQGILELMKTGSKEYDDRVSEWFVTKGDLFFMDIWNNLFRDFKEGQPSKVFGFNDCLTNGDVVDAALAVHLLSRKLYDEVPENTNLSLAAFRNLVAQYREASGVKLNQEYLRYANILQNKVLVSFISNDNKVCKVNGAVYREWLKTGGSNEILLGMLVGTKTVYSQALIDEEKERFISDWNSYSLFNITAEKNKSFNRFKDILTLSFANLLNEQSTEEKSSTDTFPLFKSKVSECFLTELDKLKSSDMGDIYNVCTRLVCRARFYYTDSEKILVGINEAVKANPHIDIREAALLSTIEYVTDYISDQLKLSTI